MTLDGIIQRWRRWRLVQKGVRVAPSCALGEGISLGLPAQRQTSATIQIGAECEIGAGVELNPWKGSIRIGRRVFIGPGCVIYGQGGVEIGDHTLLAAHCCIFSSEHEIPDAEKLVRDQPDILLSTKIGRDVWLGSGVKVLGGVTIGDGCVVGAGAVVTKSLPPKSIAMGIPARVVRQRA